ncbi:MAG: hypothetical protein MJ096_05925, partial [Clostridia bacterium]|nr:hypothetical protein [Clostridia bacterium]
MFSPFTVGYLPNGTSVFSLQQKTKDSRLAVSGFEPPFCLRQKVKVRFVQLFFRQCGTFNGVLLTFRTGKQKTAVWLSRDSNPLFAC